jgi:tRNA pseudouridine55 synthase
LKSASEIRVGDVFPGTAAVNRRTVSGNTSPTRISRRRIDGVLLLDKPTSLTSNAALMRVKRLYNAEKAGHTGTLDPLASGLLPICFGTATRFAQFLLDASKRYVATIRFGVTTTTQDADGDVVDSRPVGFGSDDLRAALRRFTGPQRQIPPAHSALKLAGKPYYHYARRGIDIPRPPREVSIDVLDLVAWTPPHATLDVECSKGTYVRALAADLGEALGCGAHLAALRRTASGGFCLADAVTLDRLEPLGEAERDRLLLPMSTLVANLPALRVAPDIGRRFLHGGAIAAAASPSGPIAVFDGDDLLGVADVAGGLAHPRRVIAVAPEPEGDGMQP